jgi:hypothetical protein
MNTDAAVREHLLWLLRGGHAHLGFDAAVRGWPVELRGKKPRGAAHTPWEVLEHMRIAQWDILEFSINAQHVSPEFPAGYWPQTAAPPSVAAWTRSVRAFKADLAAIVKLLEDPATDLYARLPHGDGQTILREALLVADHNAYHLGELLVLKRTLGAL